VLNALLVLAIMSIIGSTLTLPGIAGFVLTLGMAVDANVLINERIREELRAGRTVRQAVDQGYDKVFWTIVDSHVTTLVAGVVLMQYGSGPVRGFAVTLIIGLVASMFTSIVVTRAFMDFFTRRDTARLSV
jgi:preprotein translocase subunit SecD